ncbi:putative lipoprotein [Pseudarthrobacter siccitolerans]|uniref:Putative lipoprotein n=1 Tax=Pseudarthrobacter siccitolerans TaxID=861266 RepID=A0A024GZM9_9MICC|nr:hypothetical protein [Pseudarthrobacter siccitolerans]CCQ45067.1 putative lipoprotein [Pseudarthrobacter siccitolerans]
MGKFAALVLAAGILPACTGPGGAGDTRTEDSQPVVENRVRIGEDNWVVQAAHTSPIAEAGTMESIEITNGTDSDVSVPDAGINNVAFRVIFNGCTGILKPGEKCLVRGEWTATKVREANLEVSVAEPDAKEGSVRKGISVPLTAAAGAAPNATLPPTTGSMSQPAPSPSTTSPSASTSGSTGTATTGPATTKPATPTPAVGAPLRKVVPTLK